MISRRAASMKQYKTQGILDNNKKSSTMSSKRYSHIIERTSSQSSASSFWPAFGDKKKSRLPEDPEVAMDLLDQQIARIRSELNDMRLEGKCMGERVAKVTAAVDAVTDSSSSSTTSTCSIVEEQTLSKSLGGSTSSLPTCNSKLRDSGFVYDPSFEMCDPQKYGSCLPNNSVQFNSSKKAHSTSSIDFIHNNLNDDDCCRLKATSIDRLSCYSDSALLSIPGLRYR